MYLLVNAYSPNPFGVANSNFVGIYVTGCRGYWKTFHCDFDPLGQGQRSNNKCIFLYKPVNISPPKPFDVAASNFVCA